MDRRTFTTLTAASLLSAPNLLRAARPRHVAILGAGSAGLSAAYHLTKAGIDVRVVEAAATWGGRLKRLTGFADVPLDLGAEWIHDDPTVLGQMLGEGETDLGVETLVYQPQTYQFWNNGRLKNFDLLRFGYKEIKFFDTTWYGFFEKFVLPSVRDKIIYNAAVTEIEGRSAGVRIHLASGQSLDTDRVIVTVPLSVLQKQQIAFTGTARGPDLRALREIDFGDGFKVFLKFGERFYPDILMEGPRSAALEDTWASKIYYDAAFRKPTDQNILGLFTVSDTPLARASMEDAALLQDVLSELEAIFGNVVPDAYQGSVVQNWTQEPYVIGSYSMSNHGDQDVADILQPIEGNIFFAGEALGGDAQSTVHGAAFSARDVVDQILNG